MLLKFALCANPAELGAQQDRTKPLNSSTASSGQQEMVNGLFAVGTGNSLCFTAYCLLLAVLLPNGSIHSQLYSHPGLMGLKTARLPRFAVSLGLH